MNSSPKDSNKPIYVTRPALPSLELYHTYLEEIWNSRILTNNGPLLLQLEEKLSGFLETKPCYLVSSCDLALQLALRSVADEGDEIVTTPFSYISTASSIKWSSMKPVFADIDCSTLTISPTAVREKITERTSAILATHVFGNPCDIDALADIAVEFQIPVIYDAAHAFGVRYKGRSVFEWGDISVVSFHATKLFNTAEGGLVCGNNKAALEKCEWQRRIGHRTPTSFHGCGVNAKMSEFHAALGLALFPMIDELISGRKRVSALYDLKLRAAEKCNLQFQQFRDDVEQNYSYYPVIFQTETQLLQVLEALERENVYARRYFYPSLDTVSWLCAETIECPVSQDVASRIACLPLHADLETEAVERICEAILGCL
jgi:dTDP-4-amino-4,6-dideoxygalactose transaminase